MSEDIKAIIAKIEELNSTNPQRQYDDAIRYLKKAERSFVHVAHEEASKKEKAARVKAKAEKDQAKAEAIAKAKEEAAKNTG